jgi:lipopolysaccharide/colanic/teichoic acid biosynthesis glycosyltransferase
MLGLMALFPLFIVVGMVIWIDAGRPILFAQQRVGRRGKPFSILKFRTMRQFAGGPSITSSGDSRVTWSGRILRKFKIDELPQLFNVLKGEMSLVGPRPELSRYVNDTDRLWQQVLSVRPGITDLATLIFRNEEEVLASSKDPEDYYRRTILPAKLALNVKYIESRSPLQDVKLIALTVWYSVIPCRFDTQRIQRVFNG